MSDKEQDIVQGNLIADEVSETKETMTIAIWGEARAGKSKLIEQVTQNIKQLTSNSENVLTISEITKDYTIEEELESQAQLDGIFTQLHEADERIAKDRQDTVHLGKETRAMLTDLRKQLGIFSTTVKRKTKNGLFEIIYSLKNFNNNLHIRKFLL